MNTANVPFLSKTMIAMEQIEAYVQTYTSWHLMGLNGFVGLIYDPGFHYAGQEDVLQDSLGLKTTCVQTQMCLQQIYYQYEPDGPRDLYFSGMIT